MSEKTKTTTTTEAPATEGETLVFGDPPLTSDAEGHITGGEEENGDEDEAKES